MVRDGEEIERAIDSERTGRISVGPDRPERYGFTTREVVCIDWCPTRRVGCRVKREAGVYVQVAKQRFLKRRVIQARLARFAVHNRMLRRSYRSRCNVGLRNIRWFATAAI